MKGRVCDPDCGLAPALGPYSARARSGARMHSSAMKRMTSSPRFMPGRAQTMRRWLTLGGVVGWETVRDTSGGSVLGDLLRHHPSRAHAHAPRTHKIGGSMP